MASRNLPGLQLNGFWASGEDGWNTGMDSNLLALSALGHLHALDKDLTAPPGAPTDGAVYIVGQSATGAWATQDGKIAVRDAGAWVFLDARDGMLAYLADEGVFYRYVGGWAPLFNVIVAPQNPKFHGYLNSRQVIVADTWTKIPFNNSTHNDQGSFASGTSLFTAPFAGVYALEASWAFDQEGAGVPDWIAVGFSVNGGAPATHQQQREAHYVTDGTSVSCYSLIKLAVDDTVEVRAFAKSNTCAILADLNHFNGHLVP
jgi:hypothetical protein